MSSSDRRSWLDKAVGVCLRVLVGATALFIAVRLLEAVWTVLLVIVGVGVFIAVGIAITRARNRGW
jgi:hypothetical protein